MSNFREELLKGTFVNFLGIIGKIAGPGLLVMINQLYGTAIFGTYITAYLVIQLSLAFLTSGFKDSSVLFVSKYVDKKDEHHQMYLSLSNALSWALFFGIILVIIFYCIADAVLINIYGAEFSESLMSLLHIMVLAIPFVAFDQVIISATQGLKVMKYDAIVNGGLRPALLLIFSSAMYLVDPSVLGIGYGFILTQSVVFIYSLFVFNKMFSWRALWTAFRKYQINKEVFSFAIPQNLNMTLNKFITGIDILMLPALGATELMVGIYGTGSMIIRELRQIKLAFSSAFNPHVIKFFRDKDYKGLSYSASLTANWIASLTIPVLLFLIILNEDILNWISSESIEDATFMLLLLPIPYIYSSFSLAGNILVMTGYSSYALMNSLLVGSINVGLNLLLIPEYGLSGAALASSIATLSITILENIEARYLAKMNFSIKTIYKPHLAGLITLIVLILVSGFTAFDDSLIQRGLLALGVVLLFVILYSILDYNLVRSRIKSYLNNRKN